MTASIATPPLPPAAAPFQWWAATFTPPALSFPAGSSAQLNGAVFDAFTHLLGFYSANLATFSDVLKNLGAVWPQSVLAEVQKRIPPTIEDAKDKSVEVLQALYGSQPNVTAALADFFDSVIDQGSVNLQSILIELMAGDAVKDAQTAVKSRVRAAIVDELGGFIDRSRGAKA